MNKKSITLFDLNGSHYIAKDVKVDNNNGLLTVAAEKRTRNKRTGQRVLRSFLITISDPALEGATHSFKNGKLMINLNK